MPKSKKCCIGCSENFYNGNNPYDIKECWNYSSARLVMKKRVGFWQSPPWDMEPIKVLSCFREKGYVYVDKNRRY